MDNKLYSIGRMVSIVLQKKGGIIIEYRNFNLILLRKTVELDRRIGYQLDYKPTDR